jgi:hypothetical protein
MGGLVGVTSKQDFWRILILDCTLCRVAGRSIPGEPHFLTRSQLFVSERRNIIQHNLSANALPLYLTLYEHSGNFEEPQHMKTFRDLRLQLSDLAGNRLYWANPEVRLRRAAFMDSNGIHKRGGQSITSWQWPALLSSIARAVK